MQEEATVNGTALKALIGLLVIAAPASLGFAAYSENVSLSIVEDRDRSEDDAEVVESFEGELDENVSTGYLDLRIDRGAVRVVGWENTSYKIEVLQTPTDDDRTQVDFEDNSQDDHLNLSLIVDREHRSGVHVDAGDQEAGDDSPDRAIVAHVPAEIAYDKVYACEGQGSSIGQAFHDAWERLPMTEEDDEDHACVPADETPEPRGTIRVDADRDDEQHLNVTWGALNLHGTTLKMLIDYGSAEVDGITFDTVKLASDYGSVAGREVDIGDLHAFSDYGSIQLNGTIDTVDAVTDYGDLSLRGEIGQADAVTDYGEVTVVGTLDEAEILTDYGDVTLQLVPRTSGNLSVTTDYGDITTTVPEGERFGYDVQAATDYGDVIIGLNQTTSQQEASAEDERDDEDEHRHDDGDEAHERTRGFSDRDVQVQMNFVTDYGDIWVTNRDADLETNETEDGDDGNSGTSTLGHVPGVSELSAR